MTTEISGPGMPVELPYWEERPNATGARRRKCWSRRVFRAHIDGDGKVHITSYLRRDTPKHIMLWPEDEQTLQLLYHTKWVMGQRAGRVPTVLQYSSQGYDRNGFADDPMQAIAAAQHRAEQQFERLKEQLASWAKDVEALGKQAAAFQETLDKGFQPWPPLPF